jgi:putative flippase GtrA
MKKRILQLSRFLLVGGMVAIFNVSFLYVLTDILKIWYLASSVVSYVVATFLNFSLQKFFVFKNGALDTMGKQFIIYALVAVGNLIANTVLLYVLVDYVKIQYIVAQIGVTLLLAAVNYLINRRIIFQGSL